MGTAMPRGFYMNKKKWVYTVAAVLVALLLISLLMGDEETAARLPAMLISVMVGVGLVVAVIAAAYFFSNRHRNQEESFRASAEEVQGRVTKVERVRMVKSQSVFSVGDEMYMLRAEYDFNGKHYTKARRSYFGEPPYKTGDAIKIYVNPANPGECKILEEKDAVKA